MAVRLFVSVPLQIGSVTLERDQSHYLVNVMRAAVGDPVHLFNGQDGEWCGTITVAAKTGVHIALTQNTRSQTPESDLWLLAAPIKKDCMDWLVEKSVELGISRLWPVITARTIVTRVNHDRLTAQMIEAAEQCERLTLPDLIPAEPIARCLSHWPADRPLLFLDERGQAPSLAECLTHLDRSAGLAVIVGPEGGFTPEEGAWLRSLPFVHPVSLGPRILRAETAALCALSVIQSLTP